MQQVSVLETNIGSSTTGNSANTQIIFNDNGTLRGDTGLVFNKTTDALTVAGLVTAGSATITGAATVGTTLGVTGNTTLSSDLTVRTNKLKVDATGVGIGTATPASLFNVYRSTVGEVARFVGSTDSLGELTLTSSDNVGSGRTWTWNGASAFAQHIFQINSTTAMTLNSTGLGVGASPSHPLHIYTGGTGTTAFSNVIGTFRSGAAGRNASLQFSDTSNQAYIGMLSGALQFAAGGASTQLTLDTSGNVGVGVTPSAWLSGYKALQINATTNLFGTGTASWLTNNWTVNAAGNNTYQLGSATAATAYFQGSGAHYWFNAAAGTGTISSPTQAMTLTATGALLVGCTTAPNPGAPTTASGFSINGIGNDAYISQKIDDAPCGYFRRDGTDGTVFSFNKANSNVGTIAVTALATTYNSISDYRLKEAVQPIVGGLDRVNALKPSIYKWKVNGSAGEGFIAHELAEVVPAAVTGEKDAVNADGSIKSQGIDMSRVVPILVAAIQELTARVQTLEAR